MQHLPTSREDYVVLRKREAIEIAKQGPEDGIALLLAVRELSAILRQVPELEKRIPREDFLFMKCVSSELDGLPVGEERQYWAPSALVEKDKLARSYAARIQEEVRASFDRIVHSLE